MITLVSNRGDEVKVNGEYTIRQGIAHIPRVRLRHYGKRCSFTGPEYWCHALTKDGQKLAVVGVDK